MAYSADRYREQLKALLPPGLAFPRESGTVLDALLDSMAQELARIDARGEVLFEEAIPLTTFELLADWERVAGLPDNCSGLLAGTIQGRRNDLVSKLNARGGQSIAYFIAVARALGFYISIRELRPFRIGSGHVGDPLLPEEAVFVWEVVSPETTITYFRAGQSAVGEPLRAWGNALLECRITHLKPAHTQVLFLYYTPTLLDVGDGTVLGFPSGFALSTE